MSSKHLRRNIYIYLTKKRTVIKAYIRKSFGYFLQSYHNFHACAEGGKETTMFNISEGRASAWNVGDLQACHFLQRSF